MDDYSCVLTQLYCRAFPININNVITEVSCFGGSDGSIDLNPGGGVPPYSYLWNTGDTIQDIDSLSLETTPFR